MEKDLARFASQVRARMGRPLNVLVIGCGFFHERSLLPPDCTFTLIDLDARVIEHLKSQPDLKRHSLKAVGPEFRPSELGTSFDLIYAKEVIEHLSQPGPYLEDLRKALQPKGALWLSTPNYGEPWLPFLESTFLEWVARRSGSTRKGLHPSPFSRMSLKRAVEAAGFPHAVVRSVSLRLGLIIHFLP